MNAIKWPNAASGYKDTGEGGLFVYAVVRHDSKRDKCAVNSNVVIKLGDVLVDGTAFWNGDTGRMVSLKERAFWPELVDSRENPDSKFCRTYSKDARPMPSLHSIELAAAVLLGSSEESLWSETKGSYFDPIDSDLTAVGRAMVDALELLHDAPVELLTFLDT